MNRHCDDAPGLPAHETDYALGEVHVFGLKVVDKRTVEARRDREPDSESAVFGVQASDEPGNLSVGQCRAQAGRCRPRLGGDRIHGIMPGVATLDSPGEKSVQAGKMLAYGGGSGAPEADCYEAVQVGASELPNRQPRP